MLFIAILFVMALLMLHLLCGTALVLVALKNDQQKTRFLAVLPLLACIGILLSAGGSLFDASPFAVWLLAVVCAQVLRASGSLALAVFVAAALILLAVLLAYGLLGDPVPMWREIFSAQFSTVDSSLSADYAVLVEQMSMSATGMLAVIFLSLTLSSLFVGRWWQLRTVEKGAFRREFCQLRMGRILAMLVLALIAVSMAYESSLLLALLAPLMAVYALQGLAIMHAFVGQQPENGWMIIVFYVLLVVFNQLLVLISILGIADAWVDSRRRWLRGGGA